MKKISAKPTAREIAHMPNFIVPMNAFLTEDYFSSKDWIYERKYDGERCLAIKKKGKVTLLSRNKKILNAKYPELVADITKQKADNFIADGEVVGLEGNKMEFEFLQQHWGVNKYAPEVRKKIRIEYYLFDLLYVNATDIRDLTLLERKVYLKKLFKYDTLLKYSTHKTPEGVEYYHYACGHGWEGVMAKLASSTYVSIRSHNWLKFKCIKEQELVVGGYTSPQGSRLEFGALLLGYYEKGKFMYAGKIGTGFNEETLRTLGKKLKALQRKHCPFVNYDGKERNVHWVKPEMVVETKFSEWTKDNKLRHGRYTGLRTDKAAKDVVQEKPS